MTKLVPLTKSSAYNSFIFERDRALEKILHVHLTAIDQIVAKLERKVLSHVTNQNVVMHFIHQGAGPIRHEFELAAIQVSTLFKRLRAESYFLAHIGESEALARALRKRTKFKSHTKERHQNPLHDGANISDRVQIAVDRLRRKVEDAFSLSVVLRSDVDETKKRVSKAFPATKKRPRTTRGLHPKRLREARISSKIGFKSDGGNGAMTFGFADEDLWDDVLEDYFAKDLPEDIFARGPDDRALFYDVSLDETDERYAWEVENEVTEDFVRSVRGGANDAANENGINDFQWLAILDSHTDDCCAVRDGRTSVEIENALDEGKLDEDDSCEGAIVAPGHFNCRCKSVPMTEDMPEAPKVDYAGFDDWLEAKAQTNDATDEG